MTVTEAARPNPAPLQVICLGLGRTGTSSLREALKMLGFGPCYHMSVIIEEGGRDFATWYKIGDGKATLADFDAVFRSSRSVLDYPACLYPEELLTAYPNAKFILTTRNPVEWERSMKATILRVNDALRHRRDKASVGIVRWNELYLESYHQNLYTNTQKDIVIHNERVKSIIPPEKLLVYEVSEGWGKLVEFLGVPEPNESFPHIHDAAKFQEWLMSIGEERLGMGLNGLKN